MKTLQEIYEARTTPDGYGDKGTAHSYIPVYERLLSPMRDRVKAVLEIGVGPSALSLRMWSEYFEHAQIVGVDPDPVREPLPPRVQVFCEDAYTANTAVKLAGYDYDLIVDDGSHLLAHQLMAVRLYRALLAPEGILVIEDVVDIGSVRPAFEAIGPCAIYDLRAAKGRYDDVLVVFGSVERPRT